MSISVVGVTGDVDYAEWSRLMQDIGNAGAGMVVPSGMGVSVSTSIRGWNIAAGRSLQAGTNLISDAPVTVACAANNSGVPRYDVVYGQVDFTKSETTAGSFGVMQGIANATPVLPTLTQTTGALWQTPLAFHLVNPGTGLLSASSLVDGRPTPHGSASVVTDASGAFTINHNLWRPPTYAQITVTNSQYHAQMSSFDNTTAKAFVRKLSDGSLALNTSFTAYWVVAV